MKNWVLPTMAVVLAGSLGFPRFAQAEAAALPEESVASEGINEEAGWIAALKKQHHLADEHIQFMREQGLSYPEMALISTLSEKSGKTVDDILDMKNAGNMDWETVSRELEVSPADAKRSIASARQEMEVEKSHSKTEAKCENESSKRGVAKQKG